MDHLELINKIKSLMPATTEEIVAALEGKVGEVQVEGTLAEIRVFRDFNKRSKGTE